MVNKTKLDFIKTEAVSLLRTLKGDETPAWGKLNAQQMIEHLCDAFDDAAGLNNHKILTPPEQLDAYKNFMMSQKDFNPNTKYILMDATPAPAKMENINTALNQLQERITIFESVFKDDENKRIINPFFGELNFEENVQLLHKHMRHHLRQFKLID